MRRKARRLTASILGSSEFWLKAQTGAAVGILRKTNVIYNKISWRKPKQAEDFLRSALSCNRRNEINHALTILESGLLEYPRAECLLENYLRICCEQEQLVRFIGFINSTKKQLCETLARLNILDSPSEQKSLDGDWKHGAVLLTQTIISRNFGDDVVKLWQLADLLEHAGKLNITRKLHRKISKRETHEPDDYLYGGVSEMRLGNVDRGFKKLELGLTAYPESESIKSVYKDCCYGQLAFDRYLRLNKILENNGTETIWALDFYLQAFKLHSPESFIVKFKEAALDCNPGDLLVLQEAFLAQLCENKIPLAKAKLCIFLTRLLGLRVDFSDRMFRALYSLNWGSDDETVKYTLMLINKLTLPLVPDNDFDPEAVVNQFALDALALAQQPITLTEPVFDFSKHWAVWQSFLCLVQPRLYHHAMSAFETLAFKLWPRLDYTAPHVDRPLASPGMSRKIRIGFTVLDEMPMMSGLMDRLDNDMFETVFLHAGKRGKSKTADDWVARAGATVEYSDTDAYSAIDTIAKQELDILISGPCVPQIFFPLMARLAHLHMVLLEPNWPDGIKNSDYYISWQLAEPKNYKDFYKTPVSLLQRPPYWIEKPSLAEMSAISEASGDDIRQRLLDLGPQDRVYLCANTPPKIHPRMDEIFYKILERDPAGHLVFLRGDNSPAQLLRLRLREKLGRLYEKVIFINTVEKVEAHALLLSADCCIDSYPICGMSSSFDGIRLGAPIVTLPNDIPFGRWTAAIYEYLGVSGLTATDIDDYVRIAVRLANDKGWRLQKSAEIREKSSLYVESKASFDEFQHFIVQAWRRKQAGLPPASWVAGEWQ